MMTPRRALRGQAPLCLLNCLTDLVHFRFFGLPTAQDCPRGPKIAPRTPKMPQEGHNTAQEGPGGPPKTAPDIPQRAQRGPKRGKAKEPRSLSLKYFPRPPNVPTRGPQQAPRGLVRPPRKASKRPQKA